LLLVASAQLRTSMHDGTETNPTDNDAIVVRKRRKGIYILPNLFTLAALFGGFYAIVMAMNGKFDLAAVGIFCSMVLDSLDGRVARMTNTQSAFGEQGLGRWGWFAAFVYCSCAALRLARFNVNTTVVDKRYFQGLPSPAAAALVAGFIWLATDLGYKGPELAWPMFAVALYSGLTMVTNVPFYSFKDVSMKRSVPFAVMVLLALGIAVINIDPPTVMFGVFVLYGLSGYVVYGLRRARGIQTSVISTSTDEPDERGLHK
jgi:CDP-diacylglycerol---serine O-phosphatidyltransferase